jgi:hypothetical protein
MSGTDRPATVVPFENALKQLDYQWVSAEPREMPKWNSTLLLVELLRMPLGMMIVGGEPVSFWAEVEC